MIVPRPSKTVSEHSAAGPMARLFEDIRQTMRATGVTLDLRIYAAYERCFPALWEAVRPNVETRAFEEAADRVREEAVRAAARLDRLSVLGRAQLGESQAYQAERALLLAHYLAPRRLVFTCALSAALAADAPPARVGPPRGSVDLLERGAPLTMPPFELAAEPSDDPAARRTLRDIKRRLGVVEDEYRLLAMWPRYLAAAWERLKPVVKLEDYRSTCQRLRDLAREITRDLPYPMALSSQALGRGSEDARALAAEAARFEETLPSLVLNVALLALDWQAPELARRSPFPARARAEGTA